MKTVLAAIVLGITMNAAFALDVGDKAPNFTAIDDQGNEWRSADHFGKNEKITLVYFYPADLTGGCTKQACGFRDDMKVLTEKGVEVVGVSGDSVATHQLFKKVKELNFTLLADEKGEVAKAFGVPTKTGGTFKYEAHERIRARSPLSATLSTTGASVASCRAARSRPRRSGRPSRSLRRP